MSRSRSGGAVWECFGPFRFEIPFTVQDGKLGYPVRRARLFGVSWPKLLTPKSDAFEGVDADGRATFDVTVSLPIVGMLVRYQGWLGMLNLPNVFLKVAVRNLNGSRLNDL